MNKTPGEGTTGPDPRNLIVNYIPTQVNDAELRQLFEQYGDVETARVIVDKATNHPKGYGFVKFKTEECAARAMEGMNGFEIHTKRLKVTCARGPMRGSPSSMMSTPSATPNPATSPPQFVVVQPQYIFMGAPGQPAAAHTSGAGGPAGMPFFQPVQGGPLPIPANGTSFTSFRSDGSGQQRDPGQDSLHLQMSPDQSFQSTAGMSGMSGMAVHQQAGSTPHMVYAPPQMTQVPPGYQQHQHQHQHQQMPQNIQITLPTFAPKQ